MKILLDMGHCLSGADTGAVGNGKTEQQCTREIGYKVKSKLEALGHTVIVCSCDSAKSVGESLAYRVNKANSNGGDIYISIHLNAGGGHGTEIYTWGGKPFTEASKVLDNIVGLGYRNRGIKDGSNLYVIRNTKMKSMLIECCFMDSKTDMGKYNAEAFANAIVKGITGQIVKENQLTKEEKKMDIIIYEEGADKRAAEYLADKLQIPMISLQNLKGNPNIRKNINKAYMVGGNEKPIDNTILITGTNRYDTMKAVLNYK